MTNAIDIHRLTKTYGKNRGIEDVSFSVEQGEIFGFLGPNGAGKSTTIRCLLGLIRPTGGSAEILGMDIVRQHRDILRQVGYMPSETQFYPSMRVSEIIRFAADARKRDCREEAAKLCERLKIDTRKRIEELSLGNRKKVGIVCAMQHRPSLFIFDEPTSGLDPLIQAEFFELVKEYVADGATCFLSSHVLSEIKKNCGRAAVIREGRLIVTDTIENLAHSNAKAVHIAGLSALSLSGMEQVHAGENDISFIYNGDIKALLAALNDKNVTDITIEEPSLDDVFMHYYND